MASGYRMGRMQGRHTKPIRIQRVGSPHSGDFNPPPSWEEIAKRIGVIEGKSITRARIQAVAERAMSRLQKELLKDPLIREWAREQGIDIGPEEL
jgi:hypothetical protein